MFVVKEDDQQLRRAKQKAYEERPDVRKVEGTAGEYRVEGSQGNYYTVIAQRVGHCLTIHCVCMAGMYGSACYHAAAVLEEYSAEQARKAAAFARDPRLAHVERQLQHIARNASTLNAVRFDVADGIESAARSALHALGEYEQHVNNSRELPALVA